MGIEFEPGELFVYTNGNRWELGMVKRPGSGDGYFCWYSRGDTAAFTPTSCMHKLSNAGFTHIEQLLDDATADAVPETKYLMAIDEAREAQRKLEMCQASQRVYQSKCRSLKETNADLRRIIDDMKAADEGAGTCAMEPDGYLDEQYGIYECSNCGESWQFPYDGPRENGWKYCPHCRAEIKEDK